jgi:hypothetical protein
MTSALASQLQVVAAGRPQEERLRGKASLLYDIRDAGDIDLQTIYSVGLQGTRGSHPTRTRPSASPRTATRDAPNIHPRNRRRRPLFEGLRFSRPAAVGRVSNPRTAVSMRDPPLTRSHHSHLPGFNELTRLDGRFEQFSKSLFSRAASEENRELLDKEANKKLDQQIESYLRLLSGFYLNPAATKTLEYLIRRYKIHVHNVDAAVTCALPYHSTPEFVKLVQLCVLENTFFYFLKGVKETGAAPPRDRLVQRCLRDMAFFSFVADTAATAASQKVRTPNPIPVPNGTRFTI